MHDARLIDLLPPEGAVAVRVESIRNRSFQFSLRHTQKHWLDFISHCLQIICESCEWYLRESAVGFKISERAVDDYIVIKTF